MLAPKRLYSASVYPAFYCLSPYTLRNAQKRCKVSIILCEQMYFGVNHTVYNELHSLINNIDLEINFQFRPLLMFKINHEVIFVENLNVFKPTPYKRLKTALLLITRVMK